MTIRRKSNEHGGGPFDRESMRNVVYEVEGPTVVVRTTTRDHLHPEDEARVFPIFVDESRKQTRPIADSYLEEAGGSGGVDPEQRGRIPYGGAGMPSAP